MSILLVENNRSDLDVHSRSSAMVLLDRPCIAYRCRIHVCLLFGITIRLTLARFAIDCLLFISKITFQGHKQSYRTLYKNLYYRRLTARRAMSFIILSTDAVVHFDSIQNNLVFEDLKVIR